VFIAATLDQRLRAYDIESGAELWSARLPAGGKATPMTFRGRSGTQYVVIAAGGDGGRFGKSDKIVAFAVDARTQGRNDAK
jgi:quinoprotein glucose dehydrogenase